jgi:hypothetical protein
LFEAASVAAPLAGGGVPGIATAGEPDGYRKAVGLIQVLIRRIFV